VTLTCSGQLDLTFVVDTGAEVSCVNKRSLRKGSRYFPEGKCLVSGIDGIPRETIGNIHIPIRIGPCKLEHTFQIMPKELKVQYDGLLGLDFLAQYAVLDLPANQIIQP